jgi:hypothetical protein
MNRFALANQNPAIEEIQKWQYSFLVCGRVDVFLIRKRCCESVTFWYDLARTGYAPLTYGSGFGSGVRILLYSTVAFKMPSGSVQNNDGSRWSKNRRIRIHNTVRMYPISYGSGSAILSCGCGSGYWRQIITDLNTTSMLPSSQFLTDPDGQFIFTVKN